MDKLIGERPSPSPFIEFVWRYVTPADCTIVDRAHDFWGLVFRGRNEAWQAFLQQEAGFFGRWMRRMIAR